MTHPADVMTQGRRDALALDEAWATFSRRDQFHLPVSETTGEQAIYFCGNSLGLAPRAAASIVEEEMASWARLGVDGHFRDGSQWYDYHTLLRDPLARLVGAESDEVVAMNSLTVNLHLLLTSFYQPAGDRTVILIDAPTFPSDTYALETHLASRGLDPATHLRVIVPEQGEETIRPEAIIEEIESLGDRLAVAMIAGVNYYTGQVHDIEAITTACHTVGAVAGFDLAHAVGNIELQLHDWNVDFAVWCSYKYLNGSPGAIGGAFIHHRHVGDTDRLRLGGWWGTDPETRFRMHLNPTFQAAATADGWQLSNPPILSMAPLRASLAIFDEVGMPALRRRSIELTGILRRLLTDHLGNSVTIMTPEEAQGSQLSLRVEGASRETFVALAHHGVVGDFRPPDVIRVAPVPLYNTCDEIVSFVEILSRVLDGG